MSRYPTRAFTTLSAIVLLGTLYSVVCNTYLDTSNPLLTNLPHPLHKTHYFASKANVLNVFFSKRAWAWTSAAFLALYFTSPPTLRYKERLYKYLAETAVWVLFTGWFFGPSLLARFTVSTGGECILQLPSGAPITVPESYCYTKSTLSPQTHPSLFATSLALPQDGWSQVPRLRRGHDVSGHLFLLSMAILFLAEQLAISLEHVRSNPRNKELQPTKTHYIAMLSTLVVLVTAYFAAWTTSVYFHTPLEKFTGFGEFSSVIRLLEI